MVLFFSATGNSAHIAKVIADASGDELVDLNERMRKGDHSPLESDKPWVLVSPTYGWRLPRAVTGLLEQTPMKGCPDGYVVMSCGSSCGAAGLYAQRLLARKGLHMVGFASVVMPENYLALFRTPEREEASGIVRWSERKTKRISRAIALYQPLPKERVTPLGWFSSSVLNPLFVRFLVKDRKFSATEACVGCGLCAKVCPTGNIRIEEGKPVWQGSCIHCMACINHCPKGAIEYGRATKRRHRYLFSDSLLRKEP